MHYNAIFYNTLHYDTMFCNTIMRRTTLHLDWPPQPPFFTNNLFKSNYQISTQQSCRSVTTSLDVLVMAGHYRRHISLGLLLSSRATFWVILGHTELLSRHFAHMQCIMLICPASIWNFPMSVYSNSSQPVISAHERVVSDTELILHIMANK